MNAVKNISIGVFHGLWDSIAGMVLVFYIDSEIHRQKAEKEAYQQQRLLERQHMQRTPSPTPSSASAMERDAQTKLRVHSSRENSDERSLQSILNKPKPPALQRRVQGERKVAKQVLKCCLLNGGFTWLSIIIFEQLLLPTLKFFLTFWYGEQTQQLHLLWGWLQSILSIIFGMMWVLPIFLLSKIVSSLWFADIANAAYRVRKGRPQLISSLSKLVADFLFSLLVQVLFLVQSMLVGMLPMSYVANLLCFVHLSLLYSLYSFEYKWFNSGWELHRRLSYIEDNWPYFVGFGLPLTIITNMTSSVIVSSCIFSIFFPLFILSGNEAKPVVKTTDIPLRVFSPVIFVSNLFFNRSDRPQHKLATQKNIADQQPIKRHQKNLQQQMQRENQEKYTQFTPHAQHRYQQPPPLRSSSLNRGSTSSERSSYDGGMRPLIPTLAPNASVATPSGATVTHHR